LVRCRPGWADGHPDGDAGRRHSDCDSNSLADCGSDFDTDGCTYRDADCGSDFDTDGCTYRDTDCGSDFDTDGFTYRDTDCGTYDHADRYANHAARCGSDVHGARGSTGRDPEQLRHGCLP
jgi:hypothetical protein